MKPRKPIARRTALKRSTKPLKRVAPKRAHKSLGEEERRRRTAIREAVIRRDRVCVLNPSTANRRYLVRANELGLEHRCFGDRETVHHLKKASALGGYTFENLVLLCAHGNTWVEDHPRLATQVGLVIR